ncbi:MAG: outer membrane protein assembly factor BamD [Chitinispirillaceae bacterium]|nr:outer membrane protein assembly factor BamD [Chitinispirillaceae bacterium]
MNDHNGDIKRIVKKGFIRLPVDDETVVKAIDATIRYGKSGQVERKTLPFRRLEPVWAYALAATLALAVGAGYLVLRRDSLHSGSRAADSQVSGGRLQPKAVVVSYVADTGTVDEYMRRKGNEFLTDGRSQLLLAVGMRTRTVLFEQSDVTVDRADSLRTSISLRQGVIAVDVAPGGIDTVSIVTAYGSFTQLGTRFSVSVDSIEGASVEVYRGSVSVREIDGRDMILGPGRAWESRNGDTVATIRRDAAELEELERAFIDNKLERLLRRGPDVPSHSTVVPRKPLFKKQPSTGREIRSAAGPAVDVVRSIGAMADRGDFHAIDSVVAQLIDPATADAIAGMLLTLSRRKTDSFRFADARRLLETVVKGGIFSPVRREDASVRRYMLLKTHEETAPGDLLKELRRHRNLFPAGSFGEDMAAEEVALLMAMKRHDEAVAAIKRLLHRYPRHPQSGYYCYLHASALRENLHRNTDALDGYKRYIAAYPDGKYGEDALYWIIQLSRSSGDADNTAQYKKTYLKRYPHGRWIEEVRAIDVSVR